MKKLVRITILLLTIQFTSCVSNYNQGNYENLTKLKAYHEKFLDDFTQHQKRDYSAVALQKYREDGDLKFREAEEYAKPMGDEMRLKGLYNVHGLFNTHINDVASDHALMPQVFADQRKEVTNANYSEAIKGELSRYGAPAKSNSSSKTSE